MASRARYFSHTPLFIFISLCIASDNILGDITIYKLSGNITVVSGDTVSSGKMIIDQFDGLPIVVFKTKIFAMAASESLRKIFT